MQSVSTLGWLWKYSKLLLFIGAIHAAAFMALRTVLFVASKARLDKEIKAFEAEGGATSALAFVPKPLGRSDGPPATVLKWKDFDCPDPSSPTYPFPDSMTPDERYRHARVWRDFSTWLSSGTNPFRPSAAGPRRGVRGWSDEWLPVLERHVAASAERLELVKTLASENNTIFQADWTKGYYTSLDHVRTLNSAARLLAADAIVKARRGDAAGATEDLRVMLRLRRPIDNDPGVLPKILAYGSDSRAVSTLGRLLALGQVDREGALKVIAELDDREERNRLEKAFVSETALGIETFDVVRNDLWLIQYIGWTPMGTTTNGAPDMSPRRTTAQKLVVLFGRLVWLWPADEYGYLRDMKELRALSRRPLPEALKAATVPPSRFWPPVRLLNPMLSRSLPSAFQQQRRSDTDAMLARTALALYVYRLDSGSYPATLDALTPKYLPRMPVKPYDGKPPGYRITAKGYVIFEPGLPDLATGAAMPDTVLLESSD